VTANTVLSDINEIYTGYVLAGKKWFDSQAKAQYTLRVKQAKPEEVKDAEGKAEAMAEKFKEWAKQNGYASVTIKSVHWTARPNSMSSAVGQPVDQKKNPTDILVKFGGGPANGWLGLSAKATQTKGDIGFKNPGVGTIDRNLNMNLADMYKNLLEDTIKTYSLPASATARKLYIRANPKVKIQTEAVGVKMMEEMRDKLLEKLEKFNQKELLKYLLNDWMDAEVIESIGVKAGDKKIMKIRFKFESEKMASSLKLSGDPW